MIKPVLKTYRQSLKSEDLAVQSTGATALSKAMLSRLITDSDLLKQLVITYFDPDSSTNAQLRQSLSYFFPVYCHSRAENATRMADIVCPVISKLSTLREAFLQDDDVEADGGSGDTMVTISQVGTMLLDWTDPRKIVGFAETAQIHDAAHGAGETHFIIAEQILDRIVSGPNRDEKKVLFSMLNKLHLPAGGADPERIKTVLELAAEVVEVKAAPTITDKNVLTKIQNSLLKMMHDQMTAERGGGGAEETAVDDTNEQTEVEDVGETTEHVKADVDEDEEDDDDVSQLQQEMRDATLGATTTGFGFTTGLPDAEGTRIQLVEEEDTEMMNVDEE